MKQPGAEGPLPEELLWKALRAEDAAARMRWAREGLGLPSDGMEPDTRVLLHRQAYLAHLELRQLRRASEEALEMASLGPLRDIAYHDAARALWALGECDRAIELQRLSTRSAPADRRSFQLWSLATMQHQAGDPDAAISTLGRALRWAAGDRPLLRAHRAYIRLDCGETPRRLAETVESLHRAKCREGYGQYLLGMIAYLTGDERRASVHLRAFLRRNAAADVAKALTLRDELRRARLALASFQSA